MVNTTDFTHVATVSLVTTDGPAGSGAAVTYYRVDSDVAPFSIYTGPFLPTQFGEHTIDYWSVDAARNTETMKTSTVWCWAGTQLDWGRHPVARLRRDRLAYGATIQCGGLAGPAPPRALRAIREQPLGTRGD